MRRRMCTGTLRANSQMTPGRTDLAVLLEGASVHRYTMSKHVTDDHAHRAALVAQYCSSNVSRFMHEPPASAKHPTPTLSPEAFFVTLAPTAGGRDNPSCQYHS